MLLSKWFRVNYVIPIKGDWVFVFFRQSNCFSFSFFLQNIFVVLCVVFELRADAVMGLLSSYLFFPSFHGPELFLLFGFS